MTDSSANILTGGGHLAEALLRRGCPLAVVDNLNECYRSPWKRSNLTEAGRSGDFDFHGCDIREFQKLRQVFDQFRPSAVIHLAALAGVRPSIERPLDYAQVNRGGTANILELCQQFRVDKLIFGSSSSVYVSTSVAPFSENQAELRPISPYAATELSNALLCHTYTHLFALPAICLRFFTVYGPRQRPALAIYKFTALLEAGKPLAVHGIRAGFVQGNAKGDTRKRGTARKPSPAGPYRMREDQALVRQPGPKLYRGGKIKASKRSALAFSSEATTRKISLTESIPRNSPTSFSTIRWKIPFCSMSTRHSSSVLSAVTTCFPQPLCRKCRSAKPHR